ncbi:hypothetical protein G6F24_016105 [Rhizopus arrhizus]|nr:hypothetical protein G6F24_016105 [Rhizopus arrhizus]
MYGVVDPRLRSQHVKGGANAHYTFFGRRAEPAVAFPAKRPVVEPAARLRGDGRRHRAAGGGAAGPVRAVDRAAESL